MQGHLPVRAGQGSVLDMEQWRGCVGWSWKELILSWSHRSSVEGPWESWLWDGWYIRVSHFSLEKGGFCHYHYCSCCCCYSYEGGVCIELAHLNLMPRSKMCGSLPPHLLYTFTECCGWIVSTSASYLWWSRFKSWPRYQISWGFP
jgi:hypothetical protein